MFICGFYGILYALILWPFRNCVSAKGWHPGSVVPWFQWHSHSKWRWAVEGSQQGRPNKRTKNLYK